MSIDRYFQYRTWLYHPKIHSFVLDIWDLSYTYVIVLDPQNRQGDTAFHKLNISSDHMTYEAYQHDYKKK